MGVWSQEGYIPYAKIIYLEIFSLFFEKVEGGGGNYVLMYSKKYSPKLGGTVLELLAKNA